MTVCSSNKIIISLRKINPLSYHQHLQSNIYRACLAESIKICDCKCTDSQVQYERREDGRHSLVGRSITARDTNIINAIPTFFPLQFSATYEPIIRIPYDTCSIVPTSDAIFFRVIQTYLFIFIATNSMYKIRILSMLHKKPMIILLSSFDSIICRLSKTQLTSNRIKYR